LSVCEWQLVDQVTTLTLRFQVTTSFTMKKWPPRATAQNDPGPGFSPWSLRRKGQLTLHNAHCSPNLSVGSQVGSSTVLYLTFLHLFPHLVRTRTFPRCVPLLANTLRILFLWFPTFIQAVPWYLAQRGHPTTSLHSYIIPVFATFKQYFGRFPSALSAAYSPCSRVWCTRARP
jgi:hypothetical protein